MKGTEQDDEEFEMLLGEIPRATSAPPHAEDRQRVPNGVNNNSNNNSESVNGEANCALHREDGLRASNYEDFYEGYQNMSVSVEGNIVSLSPNLSSPLSSFYGGSSADVSPGGGNSPQLLLDHISQLKGAVQKMEQEEQTSNAFVHPNAVGLSAQQFSTGPSAHQDGVVLPSQTRVLPDDQSLAEAFANLSFKEDMAMKQVGSLENGDGVIVRRVLDGDVNCSAGVYAGGGSSSSSRTVPLPSNLYGITYPSQFNHPNGELQVGVNEIPSSTQAQGMRKLMKCNSYGANTYVNGLGLPFDNCPAGTVESQQLLPQYSARAPALPGMQGYRVLPNAPISGIEIASPMAGLQQQYYLDPLIGSYMQPQLRGPPVSGLHQQTNQIHLSWQHVEEERRMRMQQEYMLLQQPQARLPNQVGVAFPGASCNRPVRQQGLHSSLTNFLLPFGNAQPQGASFTERDWNTLPIPGMLSASALGCSEFPMQSGNACRYYAQGFCGRGESCPFSHVQLRTTASARTLDSGSVSYKDPRMVAVLDLDEKPVFPEKILTRNRTRGVNSITTINPAPSGGRKESSSNGHGGGRTLPNGYHLSALRSGSFQLDIQAHSRGVSPDITEVEIPHKTLTSSQQQQPKYTSLDEVQGRIYFIAKDQHGCRFLQRKFDEGLAEDVEKIFLEIIDHVIELMTDPFGNYLVQKLLEVCNEDQRMQILHAVTRKAGELVNISLNMHGTRAVQKLIEILKTPQQVSMVISSLKPGVVTLIKDLNGNHVVQRCLQRLSNEDNQFLFDAAAVHCVEIATHRHGCCVLQRCVDFSTGEQREHLVAVIASNALILSQDPFGNYVVQYILDLKIDWATVNVMVQLEGNCAYLSMQKFSSNVVEKCLKLSEEDGRARIVWELINSSQLGQLLQDPFANYVIQSALTVSKGALHAALVDAIRPHLPALRSSPFGKRILSRTNLKK